MERSVAFIALFAALIAVLGLLPKLTLASGVPITAQSLGVMLAGTVLGARKGFLAVLLFVVLVLIGLPLLSGGRGGFGLLATASAGYIIGFPFAALATGWFAEKWRGNIGIGAFLGAVFGGIIVLSIFGIPGMAVMLDKSMIVASGFALPFIPGDLIKAALAGVLTAALFKARPEFVFSRQGAQH